jgi:hypothetical protein
VTSLLLANFSELAKLIEHEDKATRGDLLENIALVVWCLLARMDLKSFRVGHRKRYRVGGRVLDFAGLPVETIAKWTGISRRTVTRVCTILRKARLVAGPGWSKKRGGDCFNVIGQPWEEDEHGRRKSFPAIRRFSPLFFDALGEGESLAELRKPGDPPVPAGPLPRLVRELAASHALERPPDG